MGSFIPLLRTGTCSLYTAPSAVSGTKEVLSGARLRLVPLAVALSVALGNQLPTGEECGPDGDSLSALAVSLFVVF